MATHPGRTRAVVTILVAAALVGLVAMGPLLGIPALICLILYMRSHREDVSAANAVRGLLARRCPSSGRSCSQSERSPTSLMGEDSRWWPVAVGPTIIGLVMVVVSLVLITVQRGGHPVLPPSAARSPHACGPRAAASPSAPWRSCWSRQARTPAGSLFMTIVLSLITLATLGRLRVARALHPPAGAAAV